MKKDIHFLIALLIFSLCISACQAPPAEQPVEDGSERSPNSEMTDIETAYPTEEDEIRQEPLDLDAAYPIKEEDLERLYKTWEITAYFEDGIVQDPAITALRFQADGTYETTTENGVSTGDWIHSLSSIEANLILTNEAGEALTYQIIDLEETLLILLSWQEGIQIEYQFQPAD
jgi:hypothetical protein